MTNVIPSMSDRDGKIWMDGQMVDWRDAGDSKVTCTFVGGKLREWTLERPATDG